MTAADRPATNFTYRRARSGALLFGLVIALAVETLALHLLLHAKHPAAAWLLTLSSVSVMAWLAGDFRAMGRGALAIGEGSLDLTVGWRLKARIPLSNVAGIGRVSWRELPGRSRDYLNATRPAEPNVIVSFREPVSVRLVGGARRTVMRVGLHVDDPGAFMAAVSRDAHY